ncbi:reverse transcriptase domain-containing protein [Tanacetum coccineum]
MHTRASNSEFVEPLSEPERTLNRRLRRRNRIVPFERKDERHAQPRIVYLPILDINYFHHFLYILENYNPMDDEPMWDADRVVAPILGSAITIFESANEFAIKAKTWLDELNEGTIKTWDELHTTFISRFFPQALFDRLLREIRAFSQHENETLTDAWLRMKEMLRNYHGHNLSKGNIIFYHNLNEITQEALNSIASGIFLYKTPNQAYQLLEDKVLLKLDWAKNKKTKSSLKKTVAFAKKGSSNSDTNKIMARMDAMTMKMDAQYKDMQSRSNHSIQKYDEDDKPMSPEAKAKFMQTFRQTFMDLKINLETTTKNYQASIQNLEAKFNKLADKQSVRPSGSLPGNTQPNPKVPPKLKDLKSFIIPCTFSKSFSCNALADLDASINLMSYSLYVKLSLETLKPAKISVRLADRSLQHPIGIAENMLVEVGKFTFPVDFVILKMEKDSKVSLILRRPFLHTADAVIQIKQKQLNLGGGTEHVTFLTDSAMKHSYSNDDTCFSIDVIDEILEADFNALLNEGRKKGTKNVAADQLSRIDNDETSDDSDADDNFFGETLMEITTNDIPWFADFANYLVDGMIRRCVSGPETRTTLDKYHHGPTGGHDGPNTITKKVLDSDFYYPTIIKEAHTLVRLCKACQKTRNISKRDEVPLKSIQVMAISVISVSLDSSKDNYSPASPDYSPASDIEFDPSEDLSSDHIPPLPATLPFLSSIDDSSDSDIPDTPPSPTHDTPFTETTLST